jgi:UDP-N-acetylmuramoyl-tripeptide--D-alanyl-D-alanine ligase
MRIELGIPLTLSEVRFAILGESDCDLSTVTHISTSSEDCANGDLFFALKGKFRDGEAFVQNAKSRGAMTVSAIDGDIRCDSTGLALLSLAKYYKTKLKKLSTTVAVTGSVGKTTTKEFIYELLAGSFRVHKSQGNYNNDIGLPLSLMSAPPDTEVLLLEMGMNHAGEISRLTKCAEPDVAVITNVGTSHIGNLGSRERIAKAKLEIIGGGAKLIAPYGEPLLRDYTDLSFSTKDISADLCVTRERSEVTVYRRGRKDVSANFSPLGPQFVSCLAAAIAVAGELSVNGEELVHRIEKIKDSSTRINIFKLGEVTVVEDCYNASIESFIADFKLLDELSPTSKSAMIGTIMELGELSESIHYMLGCEAAKAGLEKLYLIGETSPHIKRGAIRFGMNEANIYITNTHQEAAKAFRNNYTPGEALLIKGSRATMMERAVNHLKNEFPPDEDD